MRRSSRSSTDLLFARPASASVPLRARAGLGVRVRVRVSVGGGVGVGGGGGGGCVWCQLVADRRTGRKKRVQVRAGARVPKPTSQHQLLGVQRSSGSTAQM